MLEIPFSGIKKIEAIAGSNPEYVSLSQGSIKVGGIPQQIKKHLQELLNTDSTDYYQSCWGIKELREELTSSVQLFDGSITEKQVLPTHGCIGGLSLLFLSLLEAGDEVIIPEPAYPAYTILAQAARAKPVFIPSLLNSNPVKWGLDIERIKNTCTSKTKIIIFSNPWNPLGVIIPQETLKELISWCEQQGIYLVIDEAYRDFAFEGDFVSVLTLVNKSDHVISANSFSKNMAMSGWRAGYLVVPEKLTHGLASMQDALLNCLNNLAQHAARYALKHPEIAEHFYEIILKNRNRSLELLQPLLDEGIISLQKPQGSFFLFIKTYLEDATDLVMSILHTAKVGTVPGGSFGQTGKPFIRICYAREPEVLEEGIKRFVGYFS